MVLGIALPLSLGVVYYYFSKKPEDLGVLSFALAYGTLYMSPDMDCAHKIKLFSLRGFLTIPFRTYALFFRHRGISHSLFLGTLTRLSWLGLYSFFFLTIAYHMQPNIHDFFLYYHLYENYFIYGFAGLFIADFFHLVLDGMIK